MRVKWPADDIGDLGERIFTEAIELLEGVPYLVGFGTALGIHRDGRLIPTDTDIDLLIQPSEEQAVREALSGWPLAKVRPAKGPTRQMLFYPEQLIVDFSIWTPHDEGFGYERYRLPSFDSEWRDTKYGKVPLPVDLEDWLEELYGDWRTPEWRAKP